ncbi:MAG TPA: hypothetical protein VGI84_12240 [Pseudonocardiaceae bacterium]|jgi:hypothetical protein
MTTFSADDATAAVQRLAADREAINENLVNLEEDLGRKVLENTALQGVTGQRRAEVLDGFATLWTRYEGFRGAVERLGKIMARPDLTDADLREVEAVVSGAVTVELPELDGSPWDRQLTLAELATEIDTESRRIREVLTAVHQVWTELADRLDGCADLLGKAQALAADLGLTEDLDPVLSRLVDQLDRLRRVALTDPLRLWAGGAVATGAVDELAARCEQVRAELDRLAELRWRAAGRLDQVDRTLAEVDGLGRKIVEETRRVGTRIAGVAARAGLPSEPLRARLGAARELCRRGRWRRLGAELPALERDAATALARNQEDLIEARRPLRERDELRGRLGAYRAKAAAQGHIEDLPLEALYQRAYELLWRAPCDLARAAAAVAEYQGAVNETGTDGDPV